MCCQKNGKEQIKKETLLNNLGYKMKNILVTGGAGFIGSNVSLGLVKKGYNVTVLDIRPGR